MIGAMPAVAVRHERRRQEKRNKRPSMLFLQSPHSRSATPSPLQSPPPHPPGDNTPPPEIYICAKLSVLNAVVISLLLSAVLLIVGLVQLKPGADASHHRYILLGTGAFFLLVGVVLGVARCCLLPWQRARGIETGALPLPPPEEPATPSQIKNQRTKRHSIAVVPNCQIQQEPLLKYKRGSIAVPAVSGNNIMSVPRPTSSSPNIPHTPLNQSTEQDNPA